MILFLLALSLLLSITFPSAFHTHCFHFAAQRYSLFLSLTSLICSIVHFVVSFLLLLPIIAILPLLFATILLLMVSAIILCVSLPNLNLFNSFRSATRSFLSTDQRAYCFLCAARYYPFLLLPALSPFMLSSTICFFLSLSSTMLQNFLSFAQLW